MKKISLLLTIIISIIISISSVYALDISIDNTSIFDKSNTITVTSVSSSNLTIIPNIYNIKNISDNNNSEYIKTSYKYKDTLNDPIYITMKYDNAANSDSSLNNINIIMDLEDENGNDNQVVINNQSTSNTSNDSTSTTVTKNPQTGLFSYIIVPIILVLISLILIRYYTKYKEDNTLMILILFLLVVPLSVMAYESYKLGIIIKTDNVIIKKSTQKSEESKPSSSSPSSSQTTYVVYLYPNGGTGISEGQKFEYTETTPFSKFPSVSKTGCTLEGWNVDSPNGKEYYQNIDYTDNGRKLYARWNCSNNPTTNGNFVRTLKYPNASYKGHTVNLNSTEYVKVMRSIFGEVELGNFEMYVGLCQYIRDYIDFGHLARTYDNLGSFWLKRGGREHSDKSIEWFKQNHPEVVQAVDYVFKQGGSFAQAQMHYYYDDDDAKFNGSEEAANQRLIDASCKGGHEHQYLRVTINSNQWTVFSFEVK